DGGEELGRHRWRRSHRSQGEGSVSNAKRAVRERSQDGGECRGDSRHGEAADVSRSIRQSPATGTGDGAATVRFMIPAAEPEAERVQRARQGDQAAFTELIDP